MSLLPNHPHGPARTAHTRAILLLLLLFAITICPASLAYAQAKPPAPNPPSDVIVFTNGDQLTGTLERGAAKSIVFKSDVAGEITVSLDKIKEMHSSGSFAVLRKDIPVSRKTVTPGTLIYIDGKLTVAVPTAAPETVPANQIAYIIDQPTYDKELEKKPGPLYGWNGAVHGGATVVRSTDYGETLTAGISLVRAIPAVPFLPARNRSVFDLQETYGKLTSPVIPQTAPPSAPAVTETSIFHTDAERDEYVSPAFFALAQTSFDHNYSQGLNLQQIYGGGVGWAALKSARQELDLKANIQYEKQSFQTASSNDNLVGSTISETYHRTLPKKLAFSEFANIIPSFNIATDYSANVSGTLTLPVYKRLALSFTATDNYLNNPSAGYNKNSFQFITAASYALK
jgi:hypothetical protein